MVPERASEQTRGRQARRSIRRAAIAGLCTLGMVAAAKAAALTDPHGAGSIERHWTSNALDSGRAVSDWYTLLRGSLQQNWGGADANAKLGAEFQVKRYDTVSIEDDRVLALSAEAFRRLGPGLELRGSLSYRVSSEGDDLEIGPLTLGTRATKQVFGATAQLGIDLGNATSLVIDAAESFEKVGATRFQYDIFSPARLDPDQNRFQIAARITRTVGRFAFGASASALLIAAERLGFPPVAFSLAQYALRGEAAFKGADGSTLGLALGAEFLRGADGVYSLLRPAWQMAFVKPLPHGFELRGTFFGRYETVDSDDPLASWLRRGELEIGKKIRENLAVGSGIFAEIKQNLLFDNEERSRGVYAEATYNATRSLAVIFRIDVSETVKTVIDVHERTVDAFVGLRAKL